MTKKQQKICQVTAMYLTLNKFCPSSSLILEVRKLIAFAFRFCWICVFVYWLAGKCLGPITSGALLQTQTNGVGDGVLNLLTPTMPCIFGSCPFFSWLPPLVLLQLQNVKHCTKFPLFLPSFALRELPPSVPLRPFHPPPLFSRAPAPLLFYYKIFFPSTYNIISL